MAQFLPSFSQVRFLNDDRLGGFDKTHQLENDIRSHPLPQPMPDFTYGDDGGGGGGGDGVDSERDCSNSTKVSQVDLNEGRDTSDVIRGVNPSLVDGQHGRIPPSGTNKPYPPPSLSLDRMGKPVAATRKSGSGGGGRHRCPKCGTYTIFSHNEFGNSFYCATCSGWFTAAETLEGDVSKDLFLS